MTERFHFLMACSRVGRAMIQIIHLLIFPLNPRHPRAILTFHMLHCFISTQMEHKHFKNSRNLSRWRFPTGPWRNPLHGMASSSNLRQTEPSELFSTMRQDKPTGSKRDGEGLRFYPRQDARPLLEVPLRKRYAKPILTQQGLHAGVSELCVLTVSLNPAATSRLYF